MFRWIHGCWWHDCLDGVQRYWWRKHTNPDVLQAWPCRRKVLTDHPGKCIIRKYALTNTQQSAHRLLRAYCAIVFALVLLGIDSMLEHYANILLIYTHFLIIADKSWSVLLFCCRCLSASILNSLLCGCSHCEGVEDLCTYICGGLLYLFLSEDGGSYWSPV